MQATWADAQHRALGLADIGYWARRHPWPTVFASALCGWLLGSALVPGRRTAESAADGDSAVRPRRPSRAWVGPALSAALEVGRFVFQNAILSGWQAGSAAAPPGPAPGAGAGAAESCGAAHG